MDAMVVEDEERRPVTSLVPSLPFTVHTRMERSATLAKTQKMVMT